MPTAGVCFSMKLPVPYAQKTLTVPAVPLTTARSAMPSSALKSATGNPIGVSAGGKRGFGWNEPLPWFSRTLTVLSPHCYRESTKPSPLKSPTGDPYRQMAKSRTSSAPRKVPVAFPAAHLIVPGSTHIGKNEVHY